MFVIDKHGESVEVSEITNFEKMLNKKIDQRIKFWADFNALLLASVFGFMFTTICAWKYFTSSI